MLTEIVMNQYRTSQIAKMMDIHTNTVRLYEEIGLVSPTQRLINGYRIFNDRHVLQYTLARLALSMDKRHKTIRKTAILISKSVASGNNTETAVLMNILITGIENEMSNARSIKDKYNLVITGKEQKEKSIYLTRKKAAQYINSSPDAIRNWENKGLIQVVRKLNGYRVYIDDDIEKMRIIKLLKGLGYSLDAVKERLDILNSELDDESIYLYGQSKEYKKLMKDCDIYLIDMEKEKEISIKMEKVIESLKLIDI